MNSESKSSPFGRHLCVVGVQWGDEGKGKIVDALSSGFDAVVRFQGGANAGHTVLVGDDEYIFHLIPSGILQEDKICVIGNGVVLDPKSLVDELDGIKARGIDHEKNLFISDRAHIVLPYHRILDRYREEKKNGSKIGTTLRGIGPCYQDKSSRRGLRMADLVDFDHFEARLRENLGSVNESITKLHGGEPIALEPLLEEYRAYADRLRPRITNITDLLWELDAAGSGILFEGAQGALLDIDLGTYPYVTSSHTSFLGLGAGTGFSPRRVSSVLGITKAYTTRVGEGPFPTELDEVLGERLRQAGGEFGATTGRPRRCGWLDLYALRYAIRFGDVDALVITKLDVLDDMETIRVAVGYHGVGDIRSANTALPTDLSTVSEIEYRDLPGWKSSTADCRRIDELPEQTLAYLQFIADASERPIAMVSVGKERSQLIRFDPWLMPRSGEKVLS